MLIIITLILPSEGSSITTSSTSTPKRSPATNNTQPVPLNITNALIRLRKQPSGICRPARELINSFKINSPSVGFNAKRSLLLKQKSALKTVNKQ
jgi:hypothetical protein